MTKREQILSRLENILSSINGVVAFDRNEINVNEHKLPYVVMLDGDEITDESSYGRGRPPNGPLRIGMMPEIYVIVREGDQVGPRLNVLLARIKHAIVNDPQLIGLAMDGDIRYEGSQTALALGRSMSGEMGLNVTIYYSDRFEKPEDDELPT